MRDVRTHQWSALGSRAQTYGPQLQMTQWTGSHWSQGTLVAQVICLVVASLGLIQNF